MQNLSPPAASHSGNVVVNSLANPSCLKVATRNCGTTHSAIRDMRGMRHHRCRDHFGDSMRMRFLFLHQ